VVSNPKDPRRTHGLLWRLNYAWRVAATGLSFALFSLGGAVLASSVAVLLSLPPSGKARGRKPMRLVLSRAFRFYIGMLRFFGLLSYEIHGRERLKTEGQLVIANHPSLLDVVFLISRIDNADCIVRAGLWRNPLTAAPVRAAGFIKNESENLLQEAAATLHAGNSLVVFPEGTRTRPGEPLHFRRGAANIALSAGKDLTPVVITCEPVTLLKNQKWYHIPPRPPHYTIRVLPDIRLGEHIEPGEMRSREARQLGRSLGHFCGTKLARQPPPRQ
jgi:1-acyl-sn-glycerol-3-phosphate acyltransferase